MNNNKDMMKLYLVFAVEYDEDLVENTRAEIWTAKSREHLWDLKNPNSAGDWVPDYEPKPSPDVLKNYSRRGIENGNEKRINYLKSIAKRRGKQLNLI